MIYLADLHVHSKYSRATSKDCNLVELARWASIKGIKVLATGDFTHPVWSNEIREQLDRAEDGLFRLKEEFLPDDPGIADGLRPADVRFILAVEISSIYKKNGATRKVHNLIFMPDLEAMDRFNVKLGRIGNLKSDGRPILGLDSRDLLEITLDATPEAFLIPAHIWTPWFSMLGSRSGFDSVEECFEDLTGEVFAVETGLSSDPAMNYRVKFLDGYTLTSSSDTHSPAKLGRQANVLQGLPGYTEIREAIRAGGQGPGSFSEIQALIDSNWESIGSRLQTGDNSQSVGRLLGTIDYYPEEGKYHLDGHRKCSVSLEPEETRRLGGKCPVCGSPMTVGVLNRVVELADREPDVIPDHACPFWRLVPLDQVIGQALGVGSQSKKVASLYDELTRKLGSELRILWAMPLDEMKGRAPEIVVEAIRRVRTGQVSIAAGYDGEFGKVTLFAPGERESLIGQESLLEVGTVAARARKTTKVTVRKRSKAKAAADAMSSADVLNEEQLRAVSVLDRPVLVQAGPGTGKTKTLTHRIAAIIERGQAEPRHISAVTFTRKAAQEMRERLSLLVAGHGSDSCWVGTFHQLGMRVLDLAATGGALGLSAHLLDEDQAIATFREAIKEAGPKVSPGSVEGMFREVSRLKQNLVKPHELHEEEVRQAYASYEKKLLNLEAMDLDDLIVRPVALLQENAAVRESVRKAVGSHLLVDEFQDCNRAQYELVRLLSDAGGKSLFAIGDPDQAIYGFRGADRRFFSKFKEDYPSTELVTLTKNYRSQETVLEAAAQVLDGHGSASKLEAMIPALGKIRMAELPNAALEGEFIVRTIDAMLGGSSFFSIDSRKISRGAEDLGFADFAVLYRLNAVGDAIEEAFRSSGIPYQRVKKANPADEAEMLDPRAQVVTLMTIHASKGLEFKAVFVAGCEDGILPYSFPGRQSAGEDEIEEERRLLYVAMTRCRRDLFLTRCKFRVLHGTAGKATVSPFLQVLDPEICEQLNPLGRRGRRNSGPTQCELFT